MHGPSRGGGSGGHSGSSGGSGFHFSTSSGGSSYPRAPRYVPFFNRVLIISNWMFSFFIFAFVGIFVLVSLVITSSTSLSDSQKQIRIMEEDSIGFEKLITRANAEQDDGYYLFTIDNIHFKSDSGYLIEDDESTFFDGYSYSVGTTHLAANYCFNYGGVDYYQIYYAFTDSNGNYVTDFTYASYPDPIQTISKLTIAYQFENGVFVDSINANYKLESCMEYSKYKEEYSSSKGNCVVLGIILGAIVLAAVGVTIFAIKKSKTKQEFEEEKHQAEIEKLNAETELTKAEIKKKNRVCAYCGGEIPEDATFCPGCGSRQSE